MDGPNPLPPSLGGKGQPGEEGREGEAFVPNPKLPSATGKGQPGEKGVQGRDGRPGPLSPPTQGVGGTEQIGERSSPFPAREGGQGVRYAEYPHDALWDALRDVPDPEMGVSLVDMGLVVAARLEGDVARVTLTYTAMGCPAMQMIEEDVRARLLQAPGVGAVEIETVWEPVWTKARLTAEGRDGLLLAGLAL